ncbi:MAG: HEAT repeat domain-containing protein [Sedimentisphaerales bacterium]|nr:HEAT repeat domain-containing protein [Sedimentisphaerales bacterium]
MINRNALSAAFLIVLLFVAPAIASMPEDNYNDLLHYLQIGRFDLARGYAQAVLDGNASPVDLFDLANANQQGYALLVRAKESLTDAELAALCGKVINVIEQGRFIRRADPKVIVEEIARLSTTSRGQLNAVKRLQDAGEYAIMYMLDALADDARKAEWPNISNALSKMGKDAIRPMAAALQTGNVAVKTEIIKALGKIGHPQSLPYLKYIAEKDPSMEIRAIAVESISRIDPAAAKLPAANLFYRLGEDYYYHAESLSPADDVDFGNIWFWDAQAGRLTREQVDIGYFNELMSMRCCEWALKADPSFGQAIGLWVAGYFKAESVVPQMPAYFDSGHADAMTYATTAGPEYLHQALARAIKDKDAKVALGAVEALSTTAGESSLFYTFGPTQPLAEALSFDSKPVRYSAAIAFAAAGPDKPFLESKLVITNLAEAIAEVGRQAGDDNPMWNAALAETYALRAAKAMLKIAQGRNKVLDLSSAQDALIEATKDKRPEIQMLAGQVLAYLSTPAAQKAIAAMALSDAGSKEVRLVAFNSLAASGRHNGCMLDDRLIDEVYKLVGSMDSDPALRAAAAIAYGSLNLPSQKVKDLILDQSKS